MAATALSPKMIENVGSFGNLAVGVAGGSGTSTVVTIPQFSVVQLAIAAAGGDTATAPRCDSYSTNTFTVTHASGEVFTWIAFGKVKL